MKIEWIFFDWGGTLASVDGQPAALEKGASEVVRLLLGREDPAAAAALAARAMSAEHTAAGDPALREVDLAGLLSDWAADMGVRPEGPQLLAAVEIVGRHWVGAALSPLPGAVAAVRRLREQGYRMGLVSNCWIPTRYCLRELVIQGFLPHLDFAVISGEVGYRKPSPHIYGVALGLAGCARRPVEPERVLFVGDSPVYDCLAPQALGMRTALVAGRPGVWPPEDYARARPDHVVTAVAQLPEILTA